MDKDPALRGLLQILAHGLLEIRIAAYEGKSDVAFKVADLLHHIPLAMAAAMDRGEALQPILVELQARAARQVVEAQEQGRDDKGS
jgi:hypothetical protein